MFNKSLSKFKMYKGIHRNIDAGLIIKDIEKTLNILEQIEDIKSFKWETVKVIEFVNE